MKIAIIPARGGSKRIPRKNIKNFFGKPMISYAISSAIGSGIFDKVIVSTDDDEIAKIAVEYGAEVPFIRPVELSDDITPTVPVIKHAIDVMEDSGLKINYVCCIYPGNPFLMKETLTSALALLERIGSGYVYPITEFPSPIQRALRLAEDGRLLPLNPENEWVRTQDLEHMYYDAGQFYWGFRDSWKNGLGLQSHGAGISIPSWRVVDIDTIEDWQRAEKMYKSLNEIR